MIKFAVRKPYIRFIIFVKHININAMQSLLTILLFLSLPQGAEWIIILVVVLLLFGGRKIPELMKGIGKGIRGFKDGLKEIEDDVKSDESSSN
jgi:sec-independent protein translocase protein TatA